MKNQAQYSEHTVFVLDGYKVSTSDSDPPTQTIIVAISTENLLLNAWRQSLMGVPTYLAQDTTYRVIVEGFGVVPVGTVSPTQYFHPIAWAVTRQENDEHLKWIMQMVQTAVEAIVQEKASNQIPVRLMDRTDEK